MFGRKKQSKVEGLIHRYCELVGETVSELTTTLNAYLDGEPDAKEGFKHVEELETEADTIRFEVEHKMLKGAFLPSHRQDYVDLLETLDRVANKAEDAADMFLLVRPEVPTVVDEALREMASLTEQAWQPVPELVSRVMAEEYDIRETVKQIGAVESQVDAVQYSAIRSVFRDGELKRVDQLIMMLLLQRVGAVSDRIENVGDRLSLIALKWKLS